MDFLKFYQAIKNVFDKYREIDFCVIQLASTQYFLNELDRINLQTDDHIILKMTRLSILFEGFYRHLTNVALKQALVDVRTKRWESHHGTPTITFLLSYKNPIDQTKQFFDDFNVSSPQLSISSPWLIEQENNRMIDHTNHVLTDPFSIARVGIPKTREKIGIFTKTHNPFGGFTTAACDPFSQQFIEHAALTAQQGGKVLEIGAAFGTATLEALAKGATVFCNDIDPENLAVVQQRFLEHEQNQDASVTGDNHQLVLIPGEFPNELNGLPENCFDAILICRVLHFFTGKKIDESLAFIARLLAPGGKIYLICETPYLKNWQRFIPEFDRRVEANHEWPGEINNPADYESSGRAASLPKFVHWITKDVLERSLRRAGLAVEHAAYINRSGQFPDDLLVPEQGKESVGAIGFRR